MPYTNLLITDTAGIRTITINRPDKLNALNAQTIAELDQAFRAAQTDDTVKALILTGSGDKAFVAGADIAELDQQTPVNAAEFSRRGQVMMRLIVIGWGRGDCAPRPFHTTGHAGPHPAVGSGGGQPLNEVPPRRPKGRCSH
jgi:hypothetical protein